jgi:hypothetical protein
MDDRQTQSLQTNANQNCVLSVLVIIYASKVTHFVLEMMENTVVCHQYPQKEEIVCD